MYLFGGYGAQKVEWKQSQNTKGCKMSLRSVAGFIITKWRIANWYSFITKCLEVCLGRCQTTMM